MDTGTSAALHELAERFRPHYERAVKPPKIRVVNPRVPFVAITKAEFGDLKEQAAAGDKAAAYLVQRVRTLGPGDNWIALGLFAGKNRQMRRAEAAQRRHAARRAARAAASRSAVS